MSQRLAPGPAASSCLTCRRRHKKCDLRRPVCERCEKGGYDCLGYGRNKPKKPPASSRQCSPPIQERASLTLFGHENTISPFPSSYWSPYVLPELCLDDKPMITQYCNGPDIYLDSEIPPTLDFQSLIATHSLVGLNPMQSLQASLALSPRIPYTPYHLSKTLLGSSNLEDYVIAHCDRIIELSYFKPAQTQLVQLRGFINSRLQASKFTRWIMFLCARIFESYVKGETSQNKAFNLWVSEMEQVLRVARSGNPPSSTNPAQLGNWFQTILLRAMIVHSSNIYQVLRNVTPTFLQIVFSDPMLWSSDGDLISIPLVNVLSSSRHEVAYFALMDITAAAVFGLPQQVEYNTSLDCLSKTSLPHECVHSSPIEFQIVLAEINACRDKSPNARHWMEIENKLTTWQPRPSEYDLGWESWMVVAWLAVQESWRHALLVYLYMAACGTSSDDPRVQSSVRQIFRVIGTVKKHESADVNVPFLMQYFMAGICARSEKHRSTVREQLASLSDTRFWLMRAAEFVPVLDDLWHGAAANGRPIEWSDYLRSRERALPVVI